MKAFIQTDSNGDYFNVNAFVASVGFSSLGFEVAKYFEAEEITNKDPEAIFVGGVGMVRRRLDYLGIPQSDEIEYPKSLRPFLNRKVWTSTLKDEISLGTSNIFIKPAITKLFQGKVIRGFKDYIGLNFSEDVEIWCSEIVELVTEWRCFVRYGELLDVRYYKGRWDSKLDLSVVKAAISMYKEQPASFCLDFGVDAKEKHFLVEVNDGHSLGSYGMGAISYAKFLSARWAELTETDDMLRF